MYIYINSQLASRAVSAVGDWQRGAAEVATAARGLAARGWSPATAGNFSMRVGESFATITVSGRDKGALGARDFVLVDLEGAVVDGEGMPSAEAVLHVQLYRHDPDVGAVLHTHSPNQTIAGRLLARDGSIQLSGYELLKAFAGIDTHATSVELPVFMNTQDMDGLQQQVERRLRRGGRLYGYLIDGHGIYVWGRSITVALRYLEVFDFLLGCEIALRRTKP